MVDFPTPTPRHVCSGLREKPLPGSFVIPHGRVSKVLAGFKSIKQVCPTFRKQKSYKLQFLCDDPTKLQKILHQLQV